MELRRTRGRRSAALLAWAALLALAGLAAGQDLNVRCSVQIRQPRAGAFTTNIDCQTDGDGSTFTVVVQNATAINNAVTYRLNGEVQRIGNTSSDTYVQDGYLLSADGLGSWSQFPALVAFAFLGEFAPNAPSQTGTTLSVTASIVDVVLPSVPGLPGAGSTAAFSGLRFDGIDTLNIIDSTFDRISSASGDGQIYAAAVYVGSLLDGFVNPLLSPSISVTNTTFSNFAGGVESGALTFNGLQLNSYGTLSIADTNFTLNAAASSGAGLFASIACPASDPPLPCAQQLSLTNCRFTSNNSTDGSGGGLYLVGGPVVISRSTFTNNSAANSGGALFLISASTDAQLNVSDSTFSGNIAGTKCARGACNVENDGGAAMAVLTSTFNSGSSTWAGSAVLAVRDSTFINNRNDLVNKGGAVLFGRDRTTEFTLLDTYLPGSAINSTGLFKNVTFTNNFIPRGETTGAGGAIYDFASQGLTVDNCTFLNNTAGSGSTIFSTWSTYLNITGGTIIQNSTSQRASGGAVAMSDLQRSLTIQNAVFRDNVCRSPTTQPMSSGAALWLERQVVENPDLPFNYTASISNTQFINNRCQQAGAVYIRQVEHTIGPNVLFDGNRANVLGSAGGALLLDGLTDPQYLAAAQPSTITGTIFRNNRADSNGGALFTNGIWQPRITGCSFLNNSVTSAAILSDVGNSGGALYINTLQKASLVVSSTNFTNNTAFQGGAMTVAQSNMSMTSCWFDGNVASGEGGAVRWNTAEPGHQINMTSSNFTRNRAATAGALQVSQAGAIVSGCQFADNSASLSGGAISFESCAPAANTTLGRYTPAYGLTAGVVADSQTAYVLNSAFERNFALSMGGGAIYASSSRVVLVRSRFTDNNSTASGGALYGEQSIINDYFGNFNTNGARQGGAFYSESCNVTLNSTLIQGNSASRGGGVSVGLTRADLRYPGLVSVELNNCTATGNVAQSGIVLGAGYGGGLSSEGSNVTIRGGSWNSNTAAAGGGAIDARGNSTLVMQDVGDMRLNSARGGTGGAANFDGMLSALVINTNMQNNSALSDGGSLWSGSSHCVLLVNSNFSNSLSTTGSGGGAYFALPGTPGCSAAAINAYLPQLSPTGVAALPQALRPQGQPSGRRLLQQSTALDSIDLNLLVLGTTVTTGNAVNGGGLAMQSTPGSAAVLDRVTVRDCINTPAGTCSITGRTSTTSSDGGGMYMTMIKPVLAVQTTSTCNVLNETSTIDITSSTLTSNTAKYGGGGAAAVVSSDAALILQATFSNSTITNNTASNGGALSAEGPGAFLSVLAGTRVFANTATPLDSAAAGSSGGCIYAHNCQGLLLGNLTQLSNCQAMSGAGGRVTVNGVSATATGRSTGGAVMVDGCSAVVVDGASITGNTAGAGGGIAARDTTTLLLLNATLTGNTASVVNVTASPGATLDSLRGVGGGLWVTGDTATLVRGSDLSRNSAGLLGGAAAALTDCFNNASLTRIQVPAALADYSMLQPLAARSASGCYTMAVQTSYVANNQAQGPGANPPGSGGAFFASSNTSIVMSTCTDIQTPRSASTPVSRSANLGEVRNNLLQLSSCPSNGNLAVGYGNIVATMPMSLALDPTKTSEQPDPSVNVTDQSAVPLVWFTQNNELVLPSTSPLTPTLITLRVTDAAGQDVRDPYLSNLVTITAASADTATDNLDIYGTKVASYNSTTGDYRIDGMALKAVVGQKYMFSFTLSSTLGSVDAVPPLQQVVVVPDCSDGETYVDSQRQACRTCDGSFYAFSQNDTGLGMPAPACLPCPSEGQCSGGAVLVPIDGQWHSSPNSTAMHNCMNSLACARDDNKIASLQSCQSAWYAFRRLVQVGMTQTQIDNIATAVLDNYNCTLYTVDTLVPLNPADYLSLLCADGYGGNLCGVCVRNSNGKQTALRSNNQCSECSPEWVVYLVSAFLFVVNLLIILIQVFAALGEQMLSNTVQFADIFGAIIGHVQYLIVVLKLQFEWPSAVTEFHKVISSTVSFADDAIKFASITCLSDGSPEAQATYQMGSSLVLPLILISAAMIIWVVSYYLRLYLWYPRLDLRIKEQGSRSRGVQDSVPSELAMGPDQVMMEIKEEEEEHGQDRPETPGRGGTFGRTSGPSGHQSRFRELNPSQRAGPGLGPSGHGASGRILAHSGHGPDAGFDLPQGGSSLPARGWSDAIRSTTHRSVADIPGADAEDDAPPPNVNQMLSEPAPSLRRNQTDLRRWQLPGAEKPPEEALWFDTTAEEKERQQRKEENRNKLSLIEKFRLLDKYMPLWQQLLAVFINSGFVVYQGWASAALSPFACQFLDDGQLDSSIPENLAYYADFQMATATNGYWNLNMNQACYEGIHLSKWTPIGAVMSFVIGLGIPFLMFLPVFLNRKELTGADVQLRWGWLYIRFYYGRLPYWMAMQALELLLFIIVQTFTGGLDSVIEQAVLLQLTLLVILVFNTCMWPLVHPLLILTSFLSNAILIFTLGLAIIIGDGSSWVLSEGAANTAGAFIVILNVFYVILLLALFYKHARDVIQEGFLNTTTKTRKVVGRMWQRSLMATRGLRSMKTYTGVRSILGRSRKKTASGNSMEPGAESIEPGRNNSIEQARDAAVRAVEQEAAMDRALGEEYGHGSTGTFTGGPPRFLPIVPPS